MERVLNGDEKVRRAEEIYYRRKMGLPAGAKHFDAEKKSYLGSKIILEILIILNISILVVAVQNKDFIFTKEFLGLMAEYNVNLTESIRGMISEESTEQQNVSKESDEQLQETSQEVQTTEDKLEESVVPNEDSVSSLSQMDMDIEEINKSYSFQKPLEVEGTVTSPFGSRESVYQNVTGYHTGIDIGAEKGTSIKAAHDGYVILTSSKGDYGKHIKIENGYLHTLYAHCSKILVEEGEFVKVGQEIAKVRKHRKFYRSASAF